MKYALNVNKGTTYNHPTIGSMPGGVAVEIRDEDVNQIKNVRGIVIFEKVECRITKGKGD